MYEIRKKQFFKGCHFLLDVNFFHRENQTHPTFATNLLKECPPTDSPLHIDYPSTVHLFCIEVTSKLTDFSPDGANGFHFQARCNLLQAGDIDTKGFLRSLSAEINAVITELPPITAVKQMLQPFEKNKYLRNEL
ncbi:hypothetical protein ECG_08400 [Echinococcus granulosus]|nr:hypothetical protein ECG_08400 [Echinococcus granulosus]